MALESVNYLKHLSEPWFSLICVGAKRVEGRINRGDFANMQKGDIVTFHNDSLPDRRTVSVEITSTRKYYSFYEYLASETISRALPTVASIEEGTRVYRKPTGFFQIEDEQEFGVVAIRFRLICNKE